MTYLLAVPASKDILIRFGDRLRDLRKAGGYSQEEFADRCGLDRTYISGIERGQRNVGLRNLFGLAKALGVSLEELFRGL